jgi:hypothetical protein
VMLRVFQYSDRTRATTHPMETCDSCMSPQPVGTVLTRELRVDSWYCPRCVVLGKRGIREGPDAGGEVRSSSSWKEKEIAKKEKQNRTQKSRKGAAGAEQKEGARRNQKPRRRSNEDGREDQL